MAATHNGGAGMPMDIVFITYEATIRVAAFLGLLAVFAVIEALRPARPRITRRVVRWPANLGLAVVSTLLLRAFFPLLAVDVARLGTTAGFGLLPALALPSWLSFTVTLAALDLAVWGQHLIFHRTPLLWRLHRVHHGDPDVDVATALRFHPLEIALSMLVKIAVVAALGAPVIAVIVFEVILNSMAEFNHANLRLSTRVDRLLRWIVVTPDMHRLHHSQRIEEQLSNFGFSLSLWDRIFGTYRAAPHGSLNIGLAGVDLTAASTFSWCLLSPFGGRTKPEA